MSNISMALEKILTSFCCKITTLFRDIEIQNLLLNVTRRSYRKVNGLLLIVNGLALPILEQPLE